MLNPFFNIRIADIIDILFVATMFYTASVWVKRTPHINEPLCDDPL